MPAKLVAVCDIEDHIDLYLSPQFAPIPVGTPLARKLSIVSCLRAVRVHLRFDPRSSFNGMS